MTYELKGIGPMQIPGQFAVKQTLMDQRKLVMEVIAHIGYTPDKREARV
jgi:hypothetical protein